MSNVPRRTILGIITIIIIVAALITYYFAFVSRPTTTITTPTETPPTGTTTTTTTGIRETTTLPNITVSTIREFRLAGLWPMPPGYHGNPFGPGGVGDEIQYFIYESYYYVVPGTGELIPRLATSYEVLDGGKTWVFHIRKDAKWHDGKPFTAYDIVLSEMIYASVFRVFDPEKVAPTDNFLLKVEALDNYTVAYHFYRAVGKLERIGLLQNIFVSAAPRHIYGRFEEDAREVFNLQVNLWLQGMRKSIEGTPIPQDLKSNLTNKQRDFRLKIWDFKPGIPIGNGPYKVVKITESEVWLDRFEGHWSYSKLAADRIVIIRLPDPSVLATMISKGEIDADHHLYSVDVVEALNKANPHVKQARFSDLSEFAILFNFRKWPYNQLEFRRAIAYIIDRDTARIAGSYWSIPYTDGYSTGILKSAEKGWLSNQFLSNLTKYEKNWSKAEEYLAKIGFRKGPDGKWLGPDGKPFKIVLRTYAPHTDWVLIVQDIASQLQRFGFDVEVLLIPAGLRESILNSTEWDLALEFGVGWWGTGHPLAGYNRLYREFWIQELAGYEREPKIEINGVVYDTGRLLRELELANTTEEEKKIVEKLAYVTNEWLPVLAIMEKCLVINYLDGVRFTGWPSSEDPIWTMAPGGLPRLYILLLENYLKPAS